MIDTHAHIDTEQFDADREEVLQRARDAGVEAIIVPAITIDRTAVAERLVAENEWIYRAVGIHPHHAREADGQRLARVEAAAADYHVVAIGEIGLDYYYDFATPDEQKEVFREQLRIAKRAGLPVIIHNRDADEDVLRILDQEQDGSLRGVLHCFSSSQQVLERALALGMYVSFTGNITFPRWSGNDVLRAVPDGRFLLETDSPYMTPVPYRGKRNEPAYVRLVAQRLAEVRSTTVDAIVMHTTRAARELFRLVVVLLIGLVAVARAQRPTEAAEEFVHPFPRSIGIGGIVGLNTLVETQTRIESNITRPISYEGLPAFGAEAVWEFADRWMFDVAYLYSINRKVLDYPYFQEHPDYYQFLEAGVRYLVNPYSRVVFYGFLGASSMWVSRNGGPYSAPRLSIAPGVGLFGNVETPIGIISPGLEWRLSFLTGTEDRFVREGNGEWYKYRISTFVSIPRITLLVFPRF